MRLVPQAPELDQRVGQAVCRHALGHGGDHQQVAAARQIFEVVVGWVALGVDDDVLIVADMAHHLRVGHDLEGEPLVAAAPAPLGRAADGVAVDEQSRG